MTQHRAQPNSQTLQHRLAAIGKNYYGLLGLHPSASVIEIRQAYRQLSKRYHPDTTTLPPHIAKGKFQQLNEAYATLSNPERRAAYDLKIRYSRISVMQPTPPPQPPPRRLRPFPQPRLSRSHRSPPLPRRTLRPPPHGSLPPRLSPARYRNRRLAG